MVARQDSHLLLRGVQGRPRIATARLVVALAHEPERMVLAPFAIAGILRAPDGGRVVCLVTMESPIAELGDRLALLMGHGAATVLDYLAERFPPAASAQAAIWRRLSANLPASVGLAAAFLPVNADISGPDWQTTKVESFNALAYDLLEAAQGFWRDPACVGLWLPRADSTEAVPARPH